MSCQTQLNELWHQYIQIQTDAQVPFQTQRVTFTLLKESNVRSDEGFPLFDNCLALGAMTECYCKLQCA